MTKHTKVKRDYFLRVRIPSSIKNQLQKKADKNGITLSECVRKIVEREEESNRYTNAEALCLDLAAYGFIKLPTEDDPLFKDRLDELYLIYEKHLK